MTYFALILWQTGMKSQSQSGNPVLQLMLQLPQQILLNLKASIFFNKEKDRKEQTVEDELHHNFSLVMIYESVN